MHKRDKGLGVKILKTIGIGTAFVALSIIAPQFPYRALQAALRKKFNKNYSQTQLINSINYLKRKKFIAYTNGEYKITKIGSKHLAVISELQFTIHKQPWDNKWRMVSFDIPEEQKPARQLLRRKLISMNFYHFQRSLFVIPWPCEKELQLLCAMLQITPHVHIFVAERFTNDQKLLKSFNL